jgi:hypothetical protein
MNTDHRRRPSARLAALALAACLAAVGAAQDPSLALRQRYEQQRAALEASPFGRPLLIESNDSSGQPRGEVLAVLDHDFASVARALREPQAWCDLMVLQTTVKGCQARSDPSHGHLVAFITRRHEQTIADAYKVDFEHRVALTPARHLQVDLSAASGPVGTRDYRLTLEAVPLDGARTVTRLTYSYTAGALASMASDAYLATAGRHKIGFTVVGRDSAGKPVHVGGIRGLAERSAMRYELALEAVLDAASGTPPAQRAMARLKRWFDGIERYTAQLKEMSREEYLSMKQKEMQAAQRAPAQTG